MNEDVLKKATVILGCICDEDKGIFVPDEYTVFFKETSRTGERDGYTDMFTASALRKLAMGQSPQNPYERDDFERMLSAAKDDNNVKLRAWLHSNSERARFLQMAQREHGPIFDGSELMLAAYCLEENETFNAVKELLGSIKNN